jgi:acetyltransferase-like isoleucine patch superfamily enzyme
MKIRRSPRHDAIRAELALQAAGALLTDDERATLFGLPDGCRMRERAKIIAPEKFRCGRWVWIGEGVMLDASGELSIGDHTSIGPNTLVWTHSSHLCNLLLRNEPGSDLIVRQPTRIGSGCAINGPSVILPGVTIGDRVIVMPMSVVARDVPADSIVGGNPARVIQPVDEAFLQAERAKLRTAGS